MKKSFVRKIVTGIALISLLGATAGCGNSSESKAGSNSENNASEMKNTAAESESMASTEQKMAQATEAKKTDITVRYICLVKGIPYFDPIIDGMKTAVEAAGATFQETAPDTGDATSQIPLIEAAIQDKVSVICISPSSSDALNTALDKARNAGIKVLCVNDDITGNETHRDGAILSCDYGKLAEVSFEAFAKNMNYQGNFVVLSSSTDAPFQNNQIDVYKKLMSENTKYSKMKLLEVAYGNDEATKSLTESEAAIQKYPDLNGIIAPTSVAVVAAAQAVDNAGLSGKVVVYGLGTPSQCKDFIKSGTLSGAILWDTNRTGQVAGITAVKLASGELELKEGGSIDAGTFGNIDILANNVIYAGPPLEFTKDNVDQYKF